MKLPILSFFTLLFCSQVSCMDLVLSRGDFDKLPIELVFEIVKPFDLQSFGRFRSTCKSNKDICLTKVGLLEKCRQRPEGIEGLFCLSSYSGDSRMVTFFLLSGVDPNAKYVRRNNEEEKVFYPLSAAFMGNNSETAGDYEGVVQLLLGAKGINVNMPYEEGKRALHYAAFLGRSRGVELLLDAGANPMLKDNLGFRALFYAKKTEIKNMLVWAHLKWLGKRLVLGAGSIALVYLGYKCLSR